MADKLGARYTRYADDLTLSLAEDDRDKVQYLIRFARRVAAAEPDEDEQRTAYRGNKTVGSQKRGKIEVHLPGLRSSEPPGRS